MFHCQSDKPAGRRRSPSPRLFKRPPSPNIDPQVEIDMNRVKKQVAKVLKARLYLLEQPGPNSFHIGGDSPDHKYKVIIGPQTCTCGKDAFCVHLLFVMLRVFQLKETDPLLWTRELKNFEVESLFSKYHRRIATLSKKKFNSLSANEKAKKSNSSLPSPFVVGGVSSHVMAEEADCPICLSDLVEGESMTVCREGCQNRLHHHCMAVWAEECRRRKEKLNCPLCRTVWTTKTPKSPVTKCIPSIQPSDGIFADPSGLPRNEVIPDEFENTTKDWVELFGADAAGCLFSRDWKHRESGLRHISRKTVKNLSEKKPSSEELRRHTIETSLSVLEYVVADPVYNVYIAALRAFRALISHSKNLSQEATNVYKQSVRPVLRKILYKCADANRRINIISNKVLLEFVQSEQDNHSVQLILDCLDNPPHLSQWQWWLGRLVFLQRLLDEGVGLALPSGVTLTLCFPVSPRDGDDLHQFLSYLEESFTPAESALSDITVRRLDSIIAFCTCAVQLTHKKARSCAFSLLVKCMAFSYHDARTFARVKQIVSDLNSDAQKKLHRHLSSEMQREQADLLHILDDHEDTAGNESFFHIPEDQIRGATCVSHSNPARAKCEQQVADDEAEALQLALHRSTQRPEDVIPEQLIPTDDITLVFVQPASEAEGAEYKNVYLENVHWRKGGLLGTGAFSSCFEAMDFKSGRLMAVKQISFCRNSADEQSKVHDVVMEEVTLLTRLTHPNIVSCIGATQHDGHYNLFMEFMSGGSIKRLLARFGAFREPVILSYTHQILLGLSYLHENQTLHRDLKGANVLVDSTGQVIKLSDFGTAARLLAQGTGTKEFCGQLLGTIPFMSPEVLRGEKYGRKCDVWSLGCCLIEMATGCPPWDNVELCDNHLALMFKIASATSPPPVPDMLGPGLRDVALRCLEIKEKDRPTSNDLLLHPAFRR